MLVELTIDRGQGVSATVWMSSDKIVSVTTDDGSTLVYTLEGGLSNQYAVLESAVEVMRRWRDAIEQSPLGLIAAALEGMERRCLP